VSTNPGTTLRDIQDIISELEQQRAAIERALTALREVSKPGVQRETAAPGRKRPGPQPKKQSRMTEEGRRRLAESMKKRWAAKRAGKRGAKKAS
jgi:hypothetical protein